VGFPSLAAIEASGSDADPALPSAVPGWYDDDSGWLDDESGWFDDGDDVCDSDDP